jgi:hypothetical protein
MGLSDRVRREIGFQRGAHVDDAPQAGHEMVLLALALVDTNNDHTVSVGDTVVWGQYPALPDGIAAIRRASAGRRSY